MVLVTAPDEVLSQPSEDPKKASPSEKRKEAVLIACVLVLDIGLVVLWGFSLYNLVVKGGFPGIAGWLCWGVIYVATRLSLLRTRIDRETATGAKRSLLIRLRCLYYASWFNLVANVLAIGFIIQNLYLGRLMWTGWDTKCFAVGVMGCAVTAFLWTWKVPIEVLLCILIVTTRVFQQTSVSFSGQLLLIPLGTLVGLVLVAGQQDIVSILENGQAISSRKEASLLLIADSLNAASALAPLVTWLVRH